MSKTSIAVARFLSEADLSTVDKPIDTYTITSNLIALRERMLDNATSSGALTSIENHMNRAIGSLNPTIGDKILSILGFLGRALIYGRRF